MIYAVLMTAGILEFIFALLLVLHFFDLEAEKEAAYQDGLEDGMLLAQYEASNHMRPVLIKDDNEYYDALVDEANCWFGRDGDA